MSTIRGLTAPALTAALAAVLYLVTAVSASASTILPEADDDPGAVHAVTIVQTSGSPIWQFVAVALIAGALAVGMFLAATRLRHSHRLLPA